MDVWTHVWDTTNSAVTTSITNTTGLSRNKIFGWGIPIEDWPKLPPAQSYGGPGPTPQRFLDELRSEIDAWHGDILKAA